MRRTATALALCAALFAPVPAFAQESPRPAPSPSPTATNPTDHSTGPTPTPSDCNGGGGLSVSPPSPRTVVAGDHVSLTITERGKIDNEYLTFNESYRWATPAAKGEVQWISPDPNMAVHVIEPEQGETGTVTVALRPTTNTRIKYRFGFRTGCLFADGVSNPKDEVIDVAPRLTLNAVRNGVRN